MMKRSETISWGDLPKSCLTVLSTSFGKGDFTFTVYRFSLDNAPGRLLSCKGIVSIEGLRYDAEYAVNGWQAGPNQPAQVEVLPLTWKDRGNASISTQELGDLTSAVTAAHLLITALSSELYSLHL